MGLIRKPLHRRQQPLLIGVARLVNDLCPVDHFAIGFEMSSEMNEPVNPTINENTSNIPTLSPFSLR